MCMDLGSFRIGKARENSRVVLPSAIWSGTTYAGTKPIYPRVVRYTYFET